MVCLRRECSPAPHQPFYEFVHYFFVMLKQFCIVYSILNNIDDKIKIIIIITRQINLHALYEVHMDAISFKTNNFESGITGGILSLTII